MRWCGKGMAGKETKGSNNCSKIHGSNDGGGRSNA